MNPLLVVLRVAEVEHVAVLRDDVGPLEPVSPLTFVLRARRRAPVHMNMEISLFGIFLGDGGPGAVASVAT